MRSDSALLDFSNRLFRQCLKAYPRPHHDRFNEEMAQDFRDLCEEVLRERGLWGFLNLWVGVGLDLMKTAFEEQFKVRTYPTLEKMIRLGAISSFLAGTASIVLAFTHASPNWIDWAFHLKWIWVTLGGSNLLALLGLAAYRVLNEKRIGIGLWISLLGGTFMTLTGILIPTDARLWRLFAYGIDILAVGLLVQSVVCLFAKSSFRWIVIHFALGAFMLTFNQLTPARHLGSLFEGDGTLFASLMGISWIALGLVLFQSQEQKKVSYQ
jgi:hypothetical protein